MAVSDRPFCRQPWLGLRYCGVFAAMPAIIAYKRSAGRDLGAGVLSAYPGLPEASTGFSSHLALAWRLLKTFQSNCIDKNIPEWY